MPFALVNAAGEDVDDSKSWENLPGYLPNPAHLLYLAAASLIMTSAAYWFKPTNAAGYVKMPNVNMIVELNDMREAQRSYEANLGMLETSKTMASRTIDLLR